MDRKSILSKTAKGLMEATGKSSDLSRDLRNLLKEIDGKVTVGQLQMRQELFTEAKFMEALKSLERDGYVRESTPQPSEPMPGPKSKPPGAESGADLDFTAIASRSGAKQASEISKQIAAERERVEAAAKAKAEAEARAKAAAYESEEKRKREELDRVHREAEARAKAAAEEKAKLEAEARARREAEAEARARAAAEEKARREAEERARREAEARAKQEAEERARAKKEAEERARAKKEAEERARREAEERERQEEAARLRREEEKRRAEEEEERRKKEDDRRRWEIEARAEAAELEAQIRLERAAREEKERGGKEVRSEAGDLEAALGAERAETEERVRRENEERVRREEEERRRQEEAARLRPAAGEDAEEEIRRREEEMRRREQEEAARAKQEAKARAEADAKAASQARQDAQAREKAFDADDRRAKEQALARQKAARAGKARRPRRNLGKPVATALFLILVLSVAAMHFVPIESAPYEKAAQEWLGQPVRIGAVYVALVPSPHFRFEKIAIGTDPQVRIGTARAGFLITSILDERKVFRSVEFEGGTVPPALLAGLLSTDGDGRGIGIERVTGKGVKLDLPGFDLPNLDVDATLDTRGVPVTVRLSSPERKLTATLQPQAGRAALEITADKFTFPIGGNLSVDEFSAKGTVGRTEAAFSEFEGRAFNGTILGNARLRWADGWSLDGEFTVRQMDVAKIASPIVAGGKLEGKGIYGMKAAAPDKLLEAARMDGHFTVQKGVLTNVDMMRMLQGSSSGGGTTLISEMSGDATAASGRIQVRQLRLASGLLQGTGSVDVDPEKNLSGRVQIELRAQTVQARATLSVSGSLQNPQFRRAN